jgi:hypothetical protein
MGRTRLVSPRRIPSPRRPAAFAFPARGGFRVLSNQHHYLNFPLDAARIAHLERTRSGGDLKLMINLTLTVEKLYALHEAPIPHDVAWGFVNRLDVHVSQEITIPRSAWVARILPQIGY